jgi:hypothetical protein
MSDQLNNDSFILVPAEVFQEIAGFLTSQPYREVAHIIPKLQNLQVRKKEDVVEKPLDESAE